MTKEDNAREFYLKQFERENPVSTVFSGATKSTGDEIVKLMKKEDLTYDEAYGSLQYAYNKIKYESNFLKLQ